MGGKVVEIGQMISLEESVSVKQVIVGLNAGLTVFQAIVQLDNCMYLIFVNPGSTAVYRHSYDSIEQCLLVDLF